MSNKSGLKDGMLKLGEIMSEPQNINDNKPLVVQNIGQSSTREEEFLMLFIEQPYEIAHFRLVDDPKAVPGSDINDLLTDLLCEV